MNNEGDIKEIFGLCEASTHEGDIREFMKAKGLKPATINTKFGERFNRTKDELKIFVTDMTQISPEEALKKLKSVPKSQWDSLPPIPTGIF